MKTISDVLEVMDETNPQFRFLFDALRKVENAEDRVPQGTMRKWFRARHDKVVDTCQYGFGGVWVPTRRRIDSMTRSQAVLIEGSIREYAGCTVLHADDDTLMIRTVSENFVGWVVYTIRKPIA